MRIQAESNSYHRIIQYERITVFITFHVSLALRGARDDEPILTKAKGHRFSFYLLCSSLSHFRLFPGLRLLWKGGIYSGLDR